MVRESMKISRVGQRDSLPPSGAPGARSPLLFWIAAAAVGASILAAYSPCLHFQFILDDERFLRDPRIQYPGHVWEYFANWVWAQFAGGPASFYRPLFLLWLRGNFILNESSSWGWHFLSVLKHLSVAVLLGMLTWRLLRDRVATLIAGSLFALHPAHTESVAWVTVPDPLMSAAVLGAVLVYLRYRDYPNADENRSAGQVGGGRNDAKRGGRKARKAVLRPAHTISERPRRSIAWLIASATLYLAALLAKETSVVTLGVLFSMALLRDRGFRSRLIDAFGETSLFVGVTLVYLLLRLHALGIWISASTQHLSWSTVLLSWPATLWFYVKTLVWPVRSYAFGDPAVTDVFSVRAVLLPLLAVACAAALLGTGIWRAFRMAERELPDPEAAGVRCGLVLGALLLVLPILPALNLNGLNPEDYLHGRYTYLSLAGLMLLLATGWHLATELRRPLLIAAGSVAVTFLVLTMSQEGAWKDDRAVFAEGHRIAPRNVFVARNLVRTHVQEALGWGAAGRCKEALPVFQEAIRQFPDDWPGWAALGNCLDQFNDLRRAEQALRRASELAHLPQVTERWREVRERCGAGCQPAADWQSAPH